MGIEFFRPYLFGRKCIVVTHHRPLVSLFTHTNLSSKLTRVRVELCDYDFEIIYKKRSLNTNADALSRIKIYSDILKQMIPIAVDNNKSPKILVVTHGMTVKDRKLMRRTYIEKILTRIYENVHHCKK